MTFHINADHEVPRVLHLLKWLPRGGIETWIVHLLRNAKCFSVRHEILLMQDEVGPYGDQVRSMDIPIHCLPMTENKAKWFVDVYRFLKREGSFDVVHAHVNTIINGPFLIAAALAGVPARIAHNHAARLMGKDYSTLRNYAREGLGNILSTMGATMRIGISEQSICQLAGNNWRMKRDCLILLYGFDYSANRGAAERGKALRAKLGIAQDETVIGHVGRFDPVKNHVFLLDIFTQFAKTKPTTHLVMVGVGRLMGDMRAKAAQLGITDRCHFVGGTDDISAHMAMFDAFLFPSFSEGLGIVVLEAQAAGTPTLMTDTLPTEVIVVPGSVSLKSLDADAFQWAQSMLEIIDAPQPNAGQWLETVEASKFGMRRCVKDLDAIYRSALSEA